METLISLTVLLLPLLARGIVEAAQRRARSRPWDDLASAPSLDPKRGHKVAQLIAGSSDRAWLAGVTSVRYDVDAVARCRRRGCEPPGLDCRCGFYALRDRADALDLLDRLRTQHPARSYVLATVDLDGDVLEYERGYRAQRQRVLRIDVPGGCVVCARGGRCTPASAFVAHPHFRGEQLMHERTLLARLALPLGSAGVRPLCAAHYPSGALPARRFDLAGLRGVLATEVSTLPPGVSGARD